MTDMNNTPAANTIELTDGDLDQAQGGLLLPAVQQVREAARTPAPTEDKLGNFEIQDLMNRFNQGETLASSVQKKSDDTKSAVIGKV